MEPQAEVKIPVWLIVVIVVILFVALVIYIASLGKVDLGVEGSFPQEFKEDRQKALERHTKLSQLISAQVDLKNKLEKRFKAIYLGVRILFVLAWIGLLYFGYFIGQVKNLEDVLNYSEATLLIAFAFNFLCFGSLTNLQKTLQHIKTRLENWIYGKFISIQEEIDKNQLELFELEKTLSENVPNSIVNG